MSRSCYHYDLTDGVCDKCGTPVEVIAGHSVSVEFGDANPFVQGIEAPSVVESLALVLGVAPSDVVIADVYPYGQPWDRQMRVRWTLRGSRIEAWATVGTRQTERKVPDRTECDDDFRPIVAEATEA